MSKRAQRRHHYQRLKKKVSMYYGGSGIGSESTPWDDDQCGFMVNTRPECSCWSCGNQRRAGWTPHESIQERKEFQDSVDDLVQEYLEENKEKGLTKK